MLTLLKKYNHSLELAKSMHPHLSRVHKTLSKPGPQNQTASTSRRNLGKIAAEIFRLGIREIPLVELASDSLPRRCGSARTEEFSRSSGL